MQEGSLEICECQYIYFEVKKGSCKFTSTILTDSTFLNEYELNHLQADKQILLIKVTVATILRVRLNHKAADSPA